MTTQLVRRSNFTADALSVRKAQEVMVFAEEAAQVTEITNVAGYEMAQISVGAATAMANAMSAAANIHQRLACAGLSEPIFDDMQAKVLQVTGGNLITLTNAAQKEILQAAIAAMR